MQEERKIATEEAGETELGVAEVGVAEEGEAEEGGDEASFVNIHSLKPDASLVPHRAAVLAGTQSSSPPRSVSPSISPQTQSIAAPLSSMVSTEMYYGLASVLSINGRGCVSTD